MHDVRFVQKTCPQEGGEPVPYGQCAEPGTLAFSARRIVIDPAIRPLLGKLLRLDTMIVEGAALDLPSTDSPFELPTWPEVLPDINPPLRSEEHTSELQSLMRISYAVFCLKKKKYNSRHALHNTNTQH